MNVSRLLVKCLENEGVEYIFGIPGEENLLLLDALIDSPIRFILVRHEQGASFMADTYRQLAGKAGVCLATLGPGAINLLLGAANAGGVVVSGLEQSQDSLRLSWSREEVDARLKSIMSDIHATCIEYGQDNGFVNYVRGANIGGYVRVSDAMLAYGII